MYFNTLLQDFTDYELASAYVELMDNQLDEPLSEVVIEAFERSLTLADLESIYLHGLLDDQTSSHCCLNCTCDSDTGSSYGGTD